MKTLPKFLPVIVLAISTSIFFIACQKQIGNDRNSVPAGNTKYSVFLTDGPNDYQQVMIDIQKIEIKLDTCKTNRDEDHDRPGCDNDHDSMDHHCEIWQELDIHPGQYELLKLRNGIDTLLASGITGTGKIERIKITLGTDNNVMVDSVQHPLQLINNQNFVFINIHKEHLDSTTANDLQLFLDFDLLHSIRFLNGEYWLKPVLKPFGKHHTGEIEGKVRPVNSFGLIRAFNETDTTYARPGDEGEFKIQGLKDGTYSVLIDGLNAYQDSTIPNVIVHRREEVNLGNIELHQ